MADTVEVAVMCGRSEYRCECGGDGMMVRLR